MMLTTLLLLSPAAWFGPATVDQALPTVGNPFSPAENDVRAVFTQGGRRYERLAYYAKGKWHATLAAPFGGAYGVRFVVNGKPLGSPARVVLPPAKDGEFVLLNGTRFKLTSGKQYVPFGHNYGWQNGADAPYPKGLADMHAAGLNWTRVWADHWDGKNPYYPRESATKLALGWMDESALDRWSMVIDNCEKDAIKLQFVLFHHGLFSTTTDSNWADHPWNKAKGGFLADPTDFFVDPTAKTLTKAWLRYAVARWGHSPAIMAWELFNEVQWVDAVKVHPERVGDVIAWHREMGDYLRSIDPYRHLVTSSSSESLDPRVFATMDYLQPHTYPPSIYGALLGTTAPKDKPLFYGELGLPGGVGGGDEKSAVRDGFWGGLLAGHAGPGQYWYWDRIYKSNLYEEYARDAKVLVRSGFADNPDARPLPLKATGGVPADLLLRPGRGWGTTEKFLYDLPEEAALGALPLLSGYVQGAKGGNRAMMKEPLRFRFDAPKAGNLTIHVTGVARNGGGLSAVVNGAEAVSKTWPQAERDTSVNSDVVVPFPAGRVEIVLDNPTGDWVLIDSLRFDGVGTGVTASSLRSTRYALARLSWIGGLGTAAKTLSMPGLLDGKYEMRQFDLDAGTERVSPVTVAGGALRDYRPYAKDEGVALFKKR